MGGIQRKRIRERDCVDSVRDSLISRKREEMSNHYVFI